MIASCDATQCVLPGAIYQLQVISVGRGCEFCSQDVRVIFYRLGTFPLREQSGGWSSWKVRILSVLYAWVFGYESLVILRRAVAGRIILINQCKISLRHDGCELPLYHGAIFY